MPWSGGVYTRSNGTYTGATVWASDAAANFKIMSSRHDTHDQDLAAGINNCLAKDGTNSLVVLNLSGTIGSSSGIIKIGSASFAGPYINNSNTFVGISAGNFSGSGNFNSGFGNLALLSITSGLGNSAFGWSALGAATTGASNSAFGDASLSNLTTGSGNSAFGDSSGQLITTGSFNVVIGASCRVQDGTGTGQLSIQNAIYGTGNNGQGAGISTGNIGLYTTAPTARLHLPAGTAAAGTAPLKLTTGTNLTATEDGALEYDGTHLYFTIGSTRHTII